MWTGAGGGEVRIPIQVPDGEECAGLIRDMNQPEIIFLKVAKRNHANVHTKGQMGFSFIVFF